MVEGGKERPESMEVLRDLCSVDRLPEEMNAIRGRRLDIINLSCSRILVRQENFGRLRSTDFEMANEQSLNGVLDK